MIKLLVTFRLISKKDRYSYTRQFKVYFQTNESNR